MGIHGLARATHHRRKAIVCRTVDIRKRSRQWKVTESEVRLKWDTVKVPLTERANQIGCPKVSIEALCPLSHIVERVGKAGSGECTSHAEICPVASILVHSNIYR